MIGLKGEDIVLRCQLQGIPKPTLKWIRHNSEILYTRDHFRLGDYHYHYLVFRLA